MSEIIQVFSEFFQIIADNPASILIALGFLATILGWAVQEAGFVVLGLIMMTIGVVAHFIWLTK